MASSTGSGVAPRWSPHWQLGELDDGTLVLDGGADRRLALRGLGPALVHRVRRWARDRVAAPVEADEHRLVDRLVQVGVLTLPASMSAVRLIGAEPFSSKLAAAMEITPAANGLALLVRTGDHWPGAPSEPHLAVDCSLHHTLVLGPYVVPGLTACTACLTTRVRRRWGRQSAATDPAVQRHVHVIAELVRIQLDLIAAGTSPLVNATIAWDLELGTAQPETLLKSPGCPTCDVAVRSGRLHLPWVAQT